PGRSPRTPRPPCWLPARVCASRTASTLSCQTADTMVRRHGVRCDGTAKLRVPRGDPQLRAKTLATHLAHETARTVGRPRFVGRAVPDPGGPAYPPEIGRASCREGVSGEGGGG